jgi:uncharacterized membrane protein YdjX (TVP38/TMEM64 family)
MTMKRTYHKVTVSIGLALLIAAIPWQDVAAIVGNLSSHEWLIEATVHAGPWLLVLLLALAIVISPIPSGPIALAAGALYGTVQGGLLVVTGAFIGAMAAFTISRLLGRRALDASKHRIATWFTQPRSQNQLMLAVLTTRLIPFISFDAVSYIAGLTALTTWRFAAATAVGVIPVSFAFAGMGAGMTSGTDWTIFAALACAITLLLPLGFWIRHAVRPR